MIKSIEIKNFKSIKKKIFPMRNLNLLLGLNGMGKSSFVQTLLLLRQSIVRDGLQLNGDYTNIGTTKDALYQYSKDENLSFDLTFSDKNREVLEFE